MVSQEKKVVWQSSSSGNNKRFLQPLAATIVIVLFVALILTLGILYLGRLDNALVGFMETRGLDIIGTIEKVAQENLDDLYHTLRKDTGKSTFVPLTDAAFSPQENLIRGLVELAREVDSIWKMEDLSDDALKVIAERESLWLIAVLNEWGHVVFQSRKFPQDTAHRSPPVASRHEEIIIDLFNRFGKPEEIGYIALRRKDGSGTIVIALDDRGLRHWSTKIAIKKAIEEAGWGEGLAYLLVTDKYERVLGQSGKVPEKFDTQDFFAKSILTGRLSIASRKMTLEEKNILEILTPIRLDNKVIGIARLGFLRDRTDDILRENRYAMFISTALIVMIGIMSLWILYQNQNSHLARIEEMERKLQQAERLSALGQLAAGVAHEIRNPLNAISMATQRVQREYFPQDEDKEESFRRITGVIRDEIRRLNEIIEEFLTFSKSRRLELHNRSVTDIVQKVTNLMQEEALSRGIKIETVWSDNNVMISVDENKIKQALYNVLKNAMESIPISGTISVSVEPAGSRKIKIKISDTGSGLTQEEISRIFNPEYTTKEKGLGLGLTLAHEIIRGHRGEIRVESEVGKGSTFEIILPTETV
jgi:signal transduction histidine kinase